MIRATLLTCLLSVGVVAAQERPAGILDLTMETIAVADLRSWGGVGISEQTPHAVENCQKSGFSHLSLLNVSYLFAYNS